MWRQRRFQLQLIVHHHRSAGFHKGDTRGNVGISTKHSLALVNRGGATTAELVAVAREIAAGVRERFGVELHPEPIFVGHSWQ